MWGLKLRCWPPKKSNKVFQPWRARKRFNLASERLSKINKNHRFCYGFCTFSERSVSESTLHKKQILEPRSGLPVKAWSPFGSPRLREILRRSLRMEASEANFVPRYRC